MSAAMTNRTRHLRNRAGRSGRSSIRASHWRARRGAVIAIVAILFLSLFGIAALAVDFGRLDNLRADLQTSADAAALAGAVELIAAGGHNPALAGDTARAYATRNPAMQANVTIVSVQCGSWSDALPVFTPSACVSSLNAVQVTVSRQSSGLFMAALGVTPPNLQATARAAILPDALSCLPNCRVYLVP